MTNGSLAEPVEVVKTGVQFDLSKLSYGDLRRLQAMTPTSLVSQETIAIVLDKVVIGGLDAIPLLRLKEVVVELMAEVTEAMSGKNAPAAPSSVDSSAAESQPPSI